MTKDEALQILDTIPTIGEQVDALEMAIKALEQEPCDDWKFYYNHGYAQAKRDLFCEDCISRADALKHSHIEYDDDGEGHRVVYVEDIEDLPSVTPTSDAEGDYVSGYSCGYADAIDDMA